MAPVRVSARQMAELARLAAGADAPTGAGKRRPRPRPRPPAVRTLLGVYRSRWEQQYAQQLAVRQAAGEVAWWAYEKFTFRLADDCRYTPDFAVQLADGRWEFVEIKGGHGGRRQAGVVKFRICADEWTRMGAFVLVEKQAGSFVEIKRYER